MSHSYSVFLGWYAFVTDNIMDNFLHALAGRLPNYFSILYTAHPDRAKMRLVGGDQ